MILSILTTLRSVRFFPLGYQGSASPFTHDILLLTVHSAVSLLTFCCSYTHNFDSILLEVVRSSGLIGQA